MTITVNFNFIIYSNLNRYLTYIDMTIQTCVPHLALIKLSITNFVFVLTKQPIGTLFRLNIPVFWLNDFFFSKSTKLLQECDMSMRSVVWCKKGYGTSFYISCLSCSKYYYILYTYLLYKINKTIWMFYIKCPDKGDNPVHNTKKCTTEGDNSPV